MIRYKNRPNNRLRRSLGLLLIAAASVLSCSLSSCGITDTPPTVPAPVNKVSEYYYTLDKVNAWYHYSTIFPATNTNVTLDMQMEGIDKDYPLFRNATVYECSWILSNQPDNKTDYYYAISDSEAYYLAYDASPAATYWLDLKAPLQENATWEFPDMDGKRTVAKVIRMGAQMKLAGKSYSDIIQVEYRNMVDSSATTKFFARGLGMVYMQKVDANGNTVFQSQIK